MKKIDLGNANELIAAHYETLKTIARARRRSAKVGQTLLTTDLLHESWLKLRNQSSWNSEEHFIRTAALAMRQVIIDYARSKLTHKRGEGQASQNYDEISEILPDYRETPEQIIEIGDLLSKLDKENPRLVEIVNLRYFSGFTEIETAKVLGITDRTVRRNWQTAKAWLAAEMLEAATV